jgi:hypothetical protein
MRVFAVTATLLVAAHLCVSSAYGQTPNAGVPSAPSNLQAFGGVLTWTDTSPNEDGFRITILLRAAVQPDGESRGDVELSYEVGGNVTSFPIPGEVPKANCPDWASVEYSVVAFNEVGSSEPTSIGIFPLCPEVTEAPSTATPALATPVSPQLPPTGMRSEGHDVWLVAALGLGGAVIAGAGVVVARRR